MFGATPSISGVSVSSLNATRCTTVRAAIAALSEPCGHLPLAIYRRTTNGAHEPATEHPVASLLSGTVNPWTTAAQFREQLVRDCLLHGNAFALVIRDGQGQPVELHRLNPQSVAVEADRVTAEPSYRFSPSQGGQRIVPFSDMIHLRGALGFDGIVGISPIVEAREAIGLAITLEMHAAKLFGNGGRPSGVLSFARSLTAEAAGRMKASWQAMTSSGGTAILDNDAKYQALTLTSTDAQFLELRQFAVAEIARAFRVPPIFLQDFGRATWSNSAEMGRMFVSYSLDPWLTRIEGEFALKLLSKEDRADHFLEYDTDDITAADTAARASAYSQFRASGVYTANELRRLENLPPMPGGDVLQNPFTTTGGGTDA
ncbi:phage portal protein [Antarcticirhabdus aurantiaca]|uniref:Phage portal protein n=1 Tax=Antarcticirhabdus aurantiaca TaxID=2606717 RepID=A0ACD4NXM7_9HYPH|nr:phage portal protein [Jeongeuplla avenae]